MSLTVFKRWLDDGDTVIGIFENKDLGSRDIGRRIALSFHATDEPKMEIGKSRAPDHQKIGLGWRYILVAKTRDANEALAWMERREVGSAA